MRKGSMWVAGLMVLGLALSAPVRADEPASTGDQDQPGMGHGKAEGRMGKGRLEMMKKRLGLTDDQASQLKEFFKKQREGNKTLRDQAKVDMDTLRLKVDSNASDSEVRKLLDKLDSENKSLQASRDKMREKMRDILTPTQRAKMLLGMERMAMMGGGKHGMGMGQWKMKRSYHRMVAPGQGERGPAPVDKQSADL